MLQRALLEQAEHGRVIEAAGHSRDQLLHALPLGPLQTYAQEERGKRGEREEERVSRTHPASECAPDLRTGEREGQEVRREGGREREPDTPYL